MTEASWNNKAFTLSAKEYQKKVAKVFGNVEEDDFGKREFFTQTKNK